MWRIAEEPKGRQVCVRVQARVAPVGLIRPVLRAATPRTVLPTAAKLGVDRVHDIGIQRADLQLPNERTHVIAEVAPVVGKRVGAPSNWSR